MKTKILFISLFIIFFNEISIASNKDSIINTSTDTLNFKDLPTASLSINHLFFPSFEFPIYQKEKYYISAELASFIFLKMIPYYQNILLPIDFENSSTGVFHMLSIKFNYRFKRFTPYFQYIYPLEIPIRTNFKPFNIAFNIGSKLNILKSLSLDASFGMFFNRQTNGIKFYSLYPFLKLSYTTWASDNYNNGKEYEKYTGYKNRISISDTPYIAYERIIYSKTFVNLFASVSTLPDLSIGAEFNLTKHLFFKYRLSFPLLSDNIVLNKSGELGVRILKRFYISVFSVWPIILEDRSFYIPTSFKIGYSFNLPI